MTRWPLCVKDLKGNPWGLFKMSLNLSVSTMSEGW
jgi:hypothetical protein